MGTAKSACSSERYLFSWENIPGTDESKLIKFLGKNYSLNWINEARIKKIDSNTIEVATNTRTLSMELNEQKAELNLEIDDGRTDIFIVRSWGGNLKIYKDDAVRICNIREDRICQGDIIGNVKYIEDFEENGDYYDVSILNFPLVVILSQDCDLNEDYLYRNNIPKKYETHDKIMFSLIAAPLYNAKQVKKGDHLSLLDYPYADLQQSEAEKIKMQDLSERSCPYDQMKINQIPRYHFIEFPNNVSISDSFIDFKHYFSVNIKYLMELKRSNFICRIDMPYREFISQRFSNYLSRIGLP